jgi:hypothetical protein
MRKTWAISNLGGHKRTAAVLIGIGPDAVRAWPEALNDVVRDRVIAALVRRSFAPAIGVQPDDWFADPGLQMGYERQFEAMLEANASELTDFFARRLEATAALAAA